MVHFIIALVHLNHFIQNPTERPRKLEVVKQTILRAPSVIGEDEEGDSVADTMKHVEKQSQ